MLTVNLETGMPPAAVAGQRMSAALRSARAQRMPVVKLIHGYGSSGQGGRIRTEVRRRLSAMREAGEIRAFVRGEEFSPFDASARLAVEACPELSKDRDYSRCNQGVTVVVL